MINLKMDPTTSPTANLLADHMASLIISLMTSFMDHLMDLTIHQRRTIHLTRARPMMVHLTTDHPTKDHITDHPVVTIHMTLATTPSTRTLVSQTIQPSHSDTLTNSQRLSSFSTQPRLEAT